MYSTLSKKETIQNCASCPVFLLSGILEILEHMDGRQEEQHHGPQGPVREGREKGDLGCSQNRIREMCLEFLKNYRCANIIAI